MPRHDYRSECFTTIFLLYCTAPLFGEVASLLSGIFFTVLYSTAVGRSRLLALTSCLVHPNKNQKLLKILHHINQILEYIYYITERNDNKQNDGRKKKKKLCAHGNQTADKVVELAFGVARVAPNTIDYSTLQSQMVFAFASHMCDVSLIRMVVGKLKTQYAQIRLS